MHAKPATHGVNRQVQAISPFRAENQAEAAWTQPCERGELRGPVRLLTQPRLATPFRLEAETWGSRFEIHPVRRPQEFRFRDCNALKGPKNGFMLTCFKLKMKSLSADRYLRT